MIHRRHLDNCFRGSSPKYIIQEGGGGLSRNVWYLRCDGKFRNLAHQILQIGKDKEVVAESLQEVKKGKDRGAQKAEAMVLVVQNLSNTTGKGRSAVEDHASSKVRPHKRKRGD